MLLVGVVADLGCELVMLLLFKILECTRPFSDPFAFSLHHLLSIVSLNLANDLSLLFRIDLVCILLVLVFSSVSSLQPLIVAAWAVFRRLANNLYSRGQ